MIPAIYDRRSIRKFSSRPIDERDLLELMDSAAKAPSSKNSQPWKYVIVTGVSKHEMLDAYRRGLAREGSRDDCPPQWKQYLAAAAHTGDIMEQAPVTVLAALTSARTPPRPRPGPKSARAGTRLHPALPFCFLIRPRRKAPARGICRHPGDARRRSASRCAFRPGAVPFDFPGNPRPAAGPRQGFVSKRYNPDTTLCYCVVWNAVQTGKGVAVP